MPFTWVGNAFRWHDAKSVNIEIAIQAEKRRNNVSFCLVLAPKIIPSDVFRWHAKVIHHLQDSCIHHGWSTEVKLNVLWCIMIIEVVVNQGLVYKALESITGLTYASLDLPVVIFHGLRKHHVESEIRELRFNLFEIINVEELTA